MVCLSLGQMPCLNDSAKTLGFERYHIGSHDIGSWVAYPFVARFPDEVGRLVMLDANIPGVTLKPTIEVGPHS